MVLVLGIGPPLLNPGVCPFDQHLDSHLEGASSQWSASNPLGVAPRRATLKTMLFYQVHGIVLLDTAEYANS